MLPRRLGMREMCWRVSFTGNAGWLEDIGGVCDFAGADTDVDRGEVSCTYSVRFGPGIGAMSRGCDGNHANWTGQQSFSRAGVLSAITPSHPEAAAELYRGVGSQPSSAFALAFDSGSQARPNAVAGYEATRPTKLGGIGQGRGLCSLAFSSRT
jgi:hypothetical protein